MPLMKSLSSVRIASRAGHTIVVSPEGSFVPNVLVPEALSHGCVAVTEPTVSGVAKEPVSVGSEDSRDQRLIQIRDAVTTLVANNDPADFTATGIPRVAAVRRVLDDSVTSEEIAEAMLLVKGS